MAKVLTEEQYNAMSNDQLIAELDKMDKETFSSYMKPKVKVRYFISKYGADLISAIKGTGLFFSAVAAQKMLESTYGKSALAQLHNNFGGIKAVSGYPKVLMDTTEVIKGKKVATQDYFAKYPTPKEAFLSYVRVLKGNPAYAKVFTAETPEEQIKAMVRAGYSTLNKKGEIGVLEYMTGVQGNINRVRDMYKIGKVE